MSTLSALFEQQVDLTPLAPALIDDEGETTYAELNAEANQLARVLIRCGLGPDNLVAVALPKGRELVVVILAVTKAGAAYLPIDPTYPAERIQYMLRDSRPTLLVTNQHVQVESLNGLPVLHVDAPGTRASVHASIPDNVRDEERTLRLRDDNLVYVIYTSGSTGTPKGVAVTHAGLEDLVRAQRATINAGPGHRVLQWASVSFDAAFWDLSTALLSGAALVVVGQQDLYPGHPLNDTLRRHRVTHAVLPPVALMASDPNLPDLVSVMSTGDTCTQAIVARWAKDRRMYNGYGPTETTVGATIAGPLDANSRVTIGRAWTGCNVVVLDERLRRVPNGECGEIYVSGAGLARGYLGRPGLTAARFVANPFGVPGSRVYRTGDLGYVDEDGELVFVSRNDHQIKLRGYRVELGEVEAALAALPGVAVAVVNVFGEGLDAGLVGHVVPSGALDPEEALETLGLHLPPHMVPARLIVHDRLPMTLHGKIDRDRISAALAHERDQADDPTVTQAKSASGGERSLPVLLRIVCEILELDAAEPSGNFFRYGGNSILSAHLVRSVSSELGVPLKLRSVFEAADLKSLSEVIDELRTRY